MGMNRQFIDDMKKIDGKRVRIISEHGSYRGMYYGEYGKIMRPGDKSIGVVLDGKKNIASSYGYFWFKRNELEIIEEPGMHAFFDELSKDNGLIAGSKDWSKIFGNPFTTRAGNIADIVGSIAGVTTGRMSVEGGGPGPEPHIRLAVPSDPVADLHRYFEPKLHPMEGPDIFRHYPDQFVNYMMSDALQGCDVAQYLKGDFTMNIRVVEIARVDDMNHISDIVEARKADVIDNDVVVVAIQAKTDKPLADYQKRQLITDETKEQLKALDNRADEHRQEITAKYSDLLAILELPEINVIQVLKSSDILLDDETGLVDAASRICW